MHSTPGSVLDHVISFDSTFAVYVAPIYTWFLSHRHILDGGGTNAQARVASEACCDTYRDYPDPPLLPRRVCTAPLVPCETM